MKTIDSKLAEYDKSIHDKYAATKCFKISENNIPYQKYWRKKMMVEFSKRETYQLARILAHYQNKSIYAAKLEIAQLKWWDYVYLVDLLNFADSTYSKKVDFQFEVIWHGGVSSYNQYHDPEYEKQLLAWGDELAKYGDSSKIDEEKYPALNHVISDKIIKKETEVALNQFTDEFIVWLKKHSDFQQMIVLFWKICASHMAKESVTLNANLYSKQMRHASRALFDHSWKELKSELMHITSWWD